MPESDVTTDVPAGTPDKPVGVILTLTGAPETPHTVVGLRGQYLPNRATPIGGPGEITVAEVEAAIANGAPLEIVSVSKSKLEGLRAESAQDLEDARRGAAIARQGGLVGAEQAVLNDHVEAVKG